MSTAAGTGAVGGSFDSATIAERFRLPKSPTLLSRAESTAPIAFSRVRSELDRHPRSLEVPPESAYSFQVMLRPLVSDVWIGHRYIQVSDAAPGDTFLFDLSSRPSTAVKTPFDFVRFYLPRPALDSLAMEKGHPSAGNLSSRTFGRHDRVMYGLALAIAEAIDRPNDATALFVDYIGLAFHAHVMRAYADVRSDGALSPGVLAPWQFRRARDFMLSKLDGNPSVADLAVQCGLSASHFARAFRQTTGVPPHAWMMARRVEKAKTMLSGTDTDLADIAISCGFADQSHFTRIFARYEGHSPGRWRKVIKN